MSAALFRLVSAPALIPLLPVALHLIDKYVESLPFVGERWFRKLLLRDPRPPVQQMGSQACYDALKTYLEYQESIRFVISLSIFNVISLFFAQVEITKSALVATPYTLFGIALIFVFVLSFLIFIVNEWPHPATVNGLRVWRYAAIGLFLAVLVIEIAQVVSHSEESAVTHTNESSGAKPAL